MREIKIEKKIRVHKEFQAVTQWRWKTQSCWTERRLGMTRMQDNRGNAP